MANQKQNPVYDKRKPVYEDEKAPTGTPVKLLAGVVCFGAAVLALYILFAQPQPETAMSSIRAILRGLCGDIVPLMSLLLVWIGVLLVFSAQGRRIKPLNVVMNALLFVVGFTVVQLFSAQTIIEQHMSIRGFGNFVSKSYLYDGGGGAIGALLAYPIYTNLGQWGGLLVALLTALICLLATGRAQAFYRWVSARGDDYRERADERRLNRQQESIFGYDELDPPIRRTPEPRRRPRPDSRLELEPPRRQRRPAQYPDETAREMPRRQRRSAQYPDEMVLETPAPRQQPKPQAKRPAPRQKIYRENINPETVPSEIEQPGLDIPKPLRKIRASRQAEPLDIPDAMPRRSEADAAPRKSDFPRDIPDIFRVAGDDAPLEGGASDSVRDETESKGRLKNESQTDSAKPEPSKPRKRVTEGVRSLTEDGTQAQSVQDDDDVPFDIPHEIQKISRKRADERELEEDDDGYYYPPIDLLTVGEQVRNDQAHRDADQKKADKLIDVLDSFGIETRLLGIAHGPAVTRFELQPAPGIKVSRITALADDIALGLAALSVRIEAPIPGKSAVGVEIPNDKIEMVRLRDVLESPAAKRHTSRVAVGLGKDNSGQYIIADIAKMPHVLIAGQTGSGKSVCINSIIASILYRAAPDEVRMILIDPKVVELSIYNDIPHLIAPVVTDPKKAASALNWAVAEMSTRYKRFAERGVRDIKGYNKALEKGEKPMPQMVIVIDELADLMMVCPGEVEESICRLAQLARAAGMHLVIATQRPSVNVITGVIKANIPTRIAFSVASQVDSRTMIDHGGAEKLLGNGDMLFVPSGTNKPIRVQGSWISDEEVHAVVTYIKARSDVTYDEDVVEQIENSIRSDAEKEDVAQEYDTRLAEAVEIVIEAGQASTSMLQRRMRVGYARAGRLVDEMEKRGIVSEADGAKPRNVLISREQFRQMFDDEDEA